MNRINKLFQDKKENILSIYFCAGHPTLEGTADTIRTLERKGVEMIEIGIPFSDPLADGPVIQDAATKALRNGMSLKKLFAQLEGIRQPIGETDGNSGSERPVPALTMGGQGVNIPLILMGYMNPILRYGYEAFFKKMAELDLDGVIMPDLPFKDYLEEVKPIADRYDIRVIMLITPETSDDRIRFIDQHTDGFIYMVSSAAVTGAQKEFNAQKQAYFNHVNAMNLRNPRMIGFGISNRQTLHSAQQNAAGAIIGSKFVTLFEETQDAGKAMDKLYEALEK